MSCLPPFVNVPLFRLAASSNRGLASAKLDSPEAVGIPGASAAVHTLTPSSSTHDDNGSTDDLLLSDDDQSDDYRDGDDLHDDWWYYWDDVQRVRCV